jgi:hypothetical protein
MKIIQITAKCSDLFHANLKDEKEGLIGEYNGYVPDFFPDEHYGDYIQFNINAETGQILNWNPPTKEDLKIFS